ncbi:protein tesmin/TSO1-like CXC 2 isoform X2 [Coffea arabica]|uniref:Protein tesmin/TSO1-like CXC 2 isoform X2 n=1 Tax=Coffea arabica TaxID=13443 RepID=A0A6P6WLK5_COFAR
MDTPERSKNQINTPISKFEESPVFSFLNNLSPIQPVKSVHITQTLNALSFASLPSVFTSPHASSLKESRFLRRHQLVDPSRPEFSSDSQKKIDGNGGIVKYAHNSSEQQENFDPGNSLGETSIEPSYDCSQLAVEFVRSLNYDCKSPISSPKASCAASNKGLSEFDANAGPLVPFSLVVSEKGLFTNESSIEGLGQTNQSRDGAGCDWESLISDAADLLNFDTPKDVDSFNESPRSTTAFYTNNTNNIQNMQTFGCIEHQGEGIDNENPSTQPGEGSCVMEFAEPEEVITSSSLNSECMEGSLSQKMDAEPVSNLYRGMRRRCLVFEMAGARRKHLEENSSSVSSILLQSDGNTPSADKQLVPFKSGNDSSRCILPGIGLHLNALATTPKEFKVVKQDASVAGRLVIAPSSTANFQPIMAGQESFNESLALTSTETDMDPIENAAPLTEDANQLSALIANEEFNQISPKKKRRRLEVSGEPEGCKRCNCKKSKCLKLYCECFAAGVYCVEPCSCQECFNKPIHEDTVLATRKQIESRNPLAFAPKVIRSSDSLTEDDSSKTPASARHKRGCNCKKSGCLKKYCECYQGGVGCSINCRCEGCKNAFGRKDGSIYIGTEAELEEDETDALEKTVKDRKPHKTAIQVDVEQQNPESAPPATPLRFGRPSVQLPFSSKKKPPRSSLPSIGSSSGLYPIQGLAKPNLLHPQPKFDKHFQTVQEDELPEILQGNGSPIGGIKLASPNSKRVSPPHCDFEMSPGRRSSRKLILQSIPAFPSLTPKH